MFLVVFGCYGILNTLIGFIIKLEILIDLYFLFVIILNGESFTIVRLQE